MKNIKGHVNNHVTLYIEGMGFLGVGTFKTPDLVWKKTKFTGAAGEYERVYGAVEQLKASATIEVTNPIIYTSFAKMDDATLTFATVINKENQDVTAERNVIQGSFDIKIDERKNGEIYKISLELSPQYWFQEVGGIPQVEIDMLGNIVKVQGRDILEKTRKALELF
ncbi:phage major tail tube protein [Aliarcobacter cryaerophilus]|uniref:phage major tail tube protein n=1 Tax=Aliarcobacter cryaerophilus TaxID=28198 RepID=UPI0021B4D849|nr:phage major tail tube protein [Aliarcobacter cryaerophilus]MCT7405608.1 phage major tail tube protein [Aliarcobacter cryaerophilus]MCT7503449.1 phage major tail tube protein [Aliarcobacter cryaerophilus]